VPAIKQQSIDVLAALTRMNPQQITDIHIPSAWEGKGNYFYHCARCAFVNPLDVTAPIWRWEWLDQNLSACPTHSDEFQALQSRRVLACRNFNELLQLVIRHERELRNEIR
jgi:hypothetical protein